jgi:hypothetical protein
MEMFRFRALPVGILAGNVGTPASRGIESNGFRTLSRDGRPPHLWFEI